MLSWHASARTRAGFPIVALALIVLVVSGCVTAASEVRGPGMAAPGGSAVAATPAPPASSAAAAIDPSAVATPSMAPSPDPVAVGDTGTAEPSFPATGVAMVTLMPSAVPSLVARGASSLAPSEAPAASTGESVDTPTSTSAPPDSPFDRKTTRKLQRILDNQVRSEGIVGLQAAVRLPSGEVWLGSAGLAQVDTQRAIDPHTQFAIASVTKTFVAALVLQLVDAGKIDLDATFGTYFSDAPRKDTVTIRQLLSHTSGIYDFWQSPRYRRISRAWYEDPTAGGLRSRDHEWTYDEMMAMVKNGYFKPGKGYHYSNTNFVILGKVLEAVTGKRIDQLMRNRFFGPLGLDDTVYQPAQAPSADKAHGYWASGSGYMDHTRDATYLPFMAAVSIAGPAGAIASTARDLSVWAADLYGGKVISPGLLRQMTAIPGPGAYGLGTFEADFAGHLAYGHRGGIRGFESSMWYFPDSGVSIALLSNQGNWYTLGTSTDVPLERMVKAVLGKA